MRYLSALAALFIFISGTSELAHAQANGCHGAESNAPQSYIHQFITEDWDRLVEATPDSESFPPPSAESLRVMTNEQDADVCNEIGHPHEVDDFQSYFYTAGEYYFEMYYPKYDPDNPSTEGPVFIVNKREAEGEIHSIFMTI